RDGRGARQQLVQQPEALLRQVSEHRGDAGKVAARTVHVWNKAGPHRVPANGEYDWNRGSGSLGCQGGEITADREDDGHPLTDKLMCARRQPVVAAIRPLYWKATLRPSL